MTMCGLLSSPGRAEGSARAPISAWAATRSTMPNARPRGRRHRRDGGGRVTLRIYESLKPVICAINGPAVGIGVTMTLPMDVRLASTDARFGFVFSRRAWCRKRRPAGPSARRRHKPSLAMALFGGVFPADEALKGGLVNEVLPPEDLLPRAAKLRRTLCRTHRPFRSA